MTSIRLLLFISPPPRCLDAARAGQQRLLEFVLFILLISAIDQLAMQLAFDMPAFEDGVRLISRKRYASSRACRPDAIKYPYDDFDLTQNQSHLAAQPQSPQCSRR